MTRADIFGSITLLAGVAILIYGWAGIIATVMR
jgi:hypothetical protein